MSYMDDADRLERLDRLTSYIEQDRVIRQGWEGTDGQGRRTACVLAALAPEVAAAADRMFYPPDACPAGLMPAWLAHLTPWLDDRGSLEAWPAFLRRYAGLARRWHVLGPADWRRLDYEVRRLALEAALPFTVMAPARAARKAVRGVLVLLRRAEAGGIVSGREWAEAADAARKAALPHEGATGEQGWMAAARAASRAAQLSPPSLTDAVSQAAIAAAAEGKPWEAADRLAGSILDAIERAVTAAEACRELAR